MQEPEDDGSGVPEWVVTYGDMMSLLLTFFIMLVSMSELKSDSGKTRAALDAIRQAFGATPAEMSAPGNSQQKNSIYNARRSDGAHGKDGVKKSSENSKGRGGENKTLKRLSHQTQITLGGPAQFQRLQTDLTDELKKNLDIIAEVLKSRPHRIMIRGHASPEPLPTSRENIAVALGAIASSGSDRQVISLSDNRGLRIVDKIDLSFVRARNVTEYLIERGIPRYRIAVSAAGSSELKQKTRSKKLQHHNRRVDVFLIDSYISPAKS